MVGYDIDHSSLKQWQVAFAGASSGLITRAICQPLDVLKIRFQLQVEPISTVSISKYRSMPQALVTICREEGMRSMWKGHVPAQCLSVMYGLGQFWSFELLTKKIHVLGMDSYKPFSNFLCGSVAGSIGTVVSFPFDVVRTRLVAQSELNRMYRGTLHTLVNVYQTEGFFMLYRGLLPTLMQVTPQAGVQFMSYKAFESVYHKFVPKTDNLTQIFAISILCGSLSGLCAKVSVYPLDLAKKRLQVQGIDRCVFGQNFICDGLVDCIQRTYKVEGLLGLYKGLGPSLIKAVMTTALHFTSYELISHQMRTRIK